MVVGGIAFWLPSVLWHTWRAEDFSGRDVVALTIMLPFVMFGVARTMQRHAWQGRAPKYFAVAACIGMWVLGPLATLVSAAASGGGVRDPAG